MNVSILSLQVTHKKDLYAAEGVVKGEERRPTPAYVTWFRLEIRGRPRETPPPLGN